MKFRKYKLYAVDLIANIAEYTQTGADSRLNFLGKDNGFIYFFIFTIVTCVAKSWITTWAILLYFFSRLFVCSGIGVIGIYAGILSKEI